MGDPGLKSFEKLRAWKTETIPRKMGLMSERWKSQSRWNLANSTFRPHQIPRFLLSLKFRLLHSKSSWASRVSRWSWLARVMLSEWKRQPDSILSLMRFRIQRRENLMGLWKGE